MPLSVSLLKTGEDFSTEALYLAVTLTDYCPLKERETSIFKMGAEHNI